MGDSCHSSNPWIIQNSSFTDFHFKYCTNKPFSYDQGAQPESEVQRLDWIRRTPDSVDVDLLNDDEIANTCLTMQDCIMPPVLTMIRRNLTKALWRPYRNQFRNPEIDTMCCDPPSNLFLPPEGNNGVFSKGTATVQITGQTYYPRGSSYRDAKIIRIDFYLTSSDPLYTYIDITCSAGKDFARRNGFLGQNMARTNGIFQEIVFEGIDGPNTHTPVNQLNGISSTKSDFNEPSSSKTFVTNFKFIGPYNTTNNQYTWISWWQSWVTVSGATNNELMLVYLIAAIDWLKLSPPTGNRAVGFLYFKQAILAWKQKMTYKTDFLERYFGQMFYMHKDSLDFLLETTSNQLPRFLTGSTDFNSCYAELPGAFKAAFTKNNNPPESACSNGKILNCPAWKSDKCPKTTQMLNSAVAKSLYNSVLQIPRCSDCPGLVGNFREVIPPTNKWSSVMKKFPQCLPFRVNDTYVISDPLDLTEVPEPTPVPTLSPSFKPTMKPVQGKLTLPPSSTDISPTQSPTTEINHLYWLFFLLIIPILFMVWWTRRRTPVWSLLGHNQR